MKKVMSDSFIKRIGSVVNTSWFVFVVSLCFLMVLGQPSHVNGETEKHIGICAMPGCNCTIIVHHWIIVKCIFSDYQDVELHEGVIPADASEVSVSRCRELKIHSGAFTGGAQLKRVHVREIHSVVAKSQAFNNITAPNPLLEVTECNRVILESHAFKNAHGTLSVSISRCNHVEIKSNAFSWLLRFTIDQVPNLELSTKAFHFVAPPYGRHGPATKIIFQSVRITELPTSVFPSAAAEIRMDDVLIHVIRKDAFCPMSILGVRISNASILNIESGAFSNATLIPNFELIDVKLKSIKSGAFRAGFTNFSIQYSRLDDIESGAIAISAATVAFNNNEFNKLGKKSIALRQWSRIIIDNNLFVIMDSDAIIADEIAKATSTSPDLEFSFRGNQINTANPNSLRFVSLSEKANIVNVGNNYFKKLCKCGMEDWIHELTGKNSSTVWMSDSSYCVVSEWLENCFKLPQGYLLIKNFTNTICTPSGNITCKEPSDNPTPTVSPPSVGPHVYPQLNIYLDVEMSDRKNLEHKKRLTIIICIAAILSSIPILLLIIFGIICMRRCGVYPKLTSTPLMNFRNSRLSPSNGMTAATSARSISRLSVNEYEGLRPETRILNIESEILQQDDDTEINNDFAYTENKATQTLPEELTEEYLKDLREKLNDPDNYSQARDMIEHLYDLIKVEESCNNNNNNTDDNRQTLTSTDENPYDIIAPRVRRARVQKTMVSIGTRTPSLEKLVPIGHMTRPIVSEYIEPRDHKRESTDQNHLYAELLGDETVPSTSRLGQPIIFDNLNGRAPLPLPPDVVNDHIINGNRERKYSDVDIDSYYQGTLKKDDLNGKIEQQQQQQLGSLNFFKVFSENFMGTNKSKKIPNSSLLCEYVEPTDVNSHLYSELPETNVNSEVNLSTSGNKMANRPLPTKPDQESIINLART